MRAIDFATYLRFLSYPRDQFHSRQTRREQAFAFGIERYVPGSVMLDLDVPFHLAVEELTPLMTAKLAAAVVRAFSDELLKGIGIADTQREPVFFMVAELISKSTHVKRVGKPVRDKQRVGIVTFDGFQAFANHPTAEVPERVTLVNVNSLLRRTRERAAKIGLDWSAPFFPSPADPHAAKLITLAKQQREFALRAYRGDVITQTTGVQ